MSWFWPAEREPNHQRHAPEVDWLLAYHEDAYRYAFSLCGNADAAEELTQAAFVQAYSKREQLREHEKAKPWLLRVVRNLYLAKRRDDKKTQTLDVQAFDVPDTLNQANTAVSMSTAHEDSLAEEFTAGDVQAALQELPEGFRTPLVLYFFEDFSYKDIAEQMDLPIGTVMSRLSRGKLMLKACLERLTRAKTNPLSAG
jgi:RNA polymerase sigma-70 factor, ECF subfamily